MEQHASLVNLCSVSLGSRFAKFRFLYILTIVCICLHHVSCGRDCEDSDIELREKMAKAIITGTVKMIESDNKHQGMLRGEVEIKRVFKGSNVIENVANGIDAKTKHKMVLVEGFGDPHICESKVRIFDTRIFLLSENGDGKSLRLNSSIIRLNLFNLDRVSAAVDGKTFILPPPHLPPPP